jgi:hypothetical protein
MLARWSTPSGGVVNGSRSLARHGEKEMLKKSSKLTFKDMPQRAQRLGHTELRAAELKLVAGGGEPNSSTFDNDVDYPR